MVALLKTFGKGVLYVLGLPFFILALLIFGVIGIFAFLFQFFRSIIYFFTGQKFFPELPEDKELRLLKAGAATPIEPEPQREPDIIMPYQEEEPEPEPVFEPAIEEPVQEEPVINTIEDACFKPSFEAEPEEPAQPEEIIEEDVHEEGLNDLLDDEPEEDPFETNIPMGDEEHTILETAEAKESEEELVEELETYVPRSSNYEDDFDDEDTDTGVDIKYEDMED